MDEYDFRGIGYKLYHDDETERDGVIFISEDSQRVFIPDYVLRPAYYQALDRKDFTEDIKIYLEEDGYPVEAIPDELMEEMTDRYIQYSDNDRWIDSVEDTLKDYEDELDSLQEQYESER